ncbi:adenine-specific DNA-methyltransferase [Phycicoccus duodecadis]|uniref:Adenine-specific DNA-methyltransferase n=2 Tax=Phycicoccus duodecadis TaxID=173053 RepID=A0A2N3YFW1_9MICO|nr:adenine-specific DNA-methyltransferase [Phycicoccus duodecadis]
MGKDLALVPAEHGRYDYAWVDPADPRVREVRSIEPVGTVGDESTDDNLLLIGDSGDALQALSTIPEYAHRYRGQVKLVYIDPPFNTKQTFEHYADQLEHSVWLTLMRDRLKAIVPLLAPDASIWVHLDDSEVHRMRLLLDEVFGTNRSATQIVWQKRTTRENRAAFSDNHDHLLVYTVPPVTQWRDVRNRLARTDTTKNPDDDPRGPWDSVPFTAQGSRANQMYKITTPTGVVHDPPPNRCWGAVQSVYERYLADGRVYFPKNGNGRPRIKQFASEAPGLVPHTIWLAAEVGSNDEAKKHIQSLFPGVPPFDTPKPERLLERIIGIATNPGDLVLDCFAGSGTTAATAHKMGRRWVTVELIESTADTFIVPRLTRVVEGTDPGGITSTTTRVPVEDLPEGMTATEAQAFRALLGKVAKAVEGLDDATLKALREATRTRNEVATHWEGGGGFTVARIGPSMYDVDEESGTVFLSPEATNGRWSKAVAGQLKFTLTPEHPVFCGQRNRQRLAVIDGVADDLVIRSLVQHLADGETLTVVAKATLPEAAILLGNLRPGSRLRIAPDDLFPATTVK